jgi:hypothetical protein
MAVVIYGGSRGTTDRRQKFRLQVARIGNVLDCAVPIGAAGKCLMPS